MNYKIFDERSYVLDAFFATFDFYPSSVDDYSVFFLDFLRRRCESLGHSYPPSAYSIDFDGRIFLKF